MKTPFEIVNDMSPRGTIELRNLNIKLKHSVEAKEIVDFMKNLHEEINNNLITVTRDIRKE